MIADGERLSHPGTSAENSRLWKLKLSWDASNLQRRSRSIVSEAMFGGLPCGFLRNQLWQWDSRLDRVGAHDYKGNLPKCMSTRLCQILQICSFFILSCGWIAWLLQVVCSFACQFAWTREMHHFMKICHNNSFSWKGGHFSYTCTQKGSYNINWAYKRHTCLWRWSCPATRQVRNSERQDLFFSAWGGLMWQSLATVPGFHNWVADCLPLELLTAWALDETWWLAPSRCCC